MYYSFIQPYTIDSQRIDISEAKDIGQMRHCFFSVPKVDTQAALKTFDPFPIELKAFYNEIGFGFIHRKKFELNMLLDPMSLVNTNLRLGYYKNEPNIMQAFQHCDPEKQLLFFKTHTNNYLSINRVDIQGKNAVFYQKKQINNSLHDFLMHYHKNRDYLKDYIEDVFLEDKKRNKNNSGNQKKVKYVGGHILLDPY